MAGFYTVKLAEQRDRARLETQKAQQVAQVLKEVFVISCETSTGRRTACGRSPQHEKGGRDLPSTVAISRGRFDVYRRALVGRLDIESGEILAFLGYSLKEQFELAAAESVLTQSLDIRRRLGEPDENVLTVAMNNLARVYHDMSKFERADSLFTEVARIVGANQGDVDPDLAAILLNHAHTKRELGDLEDRTREERAGAASCQPRKV